MIVNKINQAQTIRCTPINVFGIHNNALVDMHVVCDHQKVTRD